MTGPEERLAEDTLFLACTRPAMFLGVPMEAVGLNIILTAIAFLAGHSLLYLLIAPALHLVFQAICKADHNAFRVLWLYVETQRPVAQWFGLGRQFEDPPAASPPLQRPGVAPWLTPAPP